MKGLTLNFPVCEKIAELQLADCPQSPELSAAVEQLGVKYFNDLRRVSFQDLRGISGAASAVTLELGCLIRRAERGEFGRPVGAPCPHEDLIEPLLTEPGEPTGEAISIPEAACGLPLSFFQVTGRLKTILGWLGFSQAGDLQGRPYERFLKLRNFGPKTLQDLRTLVRQVGEAAALGLQPRPCKEAPASKRMRAFAISAAAREVVPYDFPISTRVDGVLRRKGITRLGDLHGMEFGELLRVRGCGQKSLQAILRLVERAGAGEFQVGASGEQRSSAAHVGRLRRP